MSAIARAAVTPLLAEPSLRAEQVNQLVLGETAELLDSSGEWRRVRSHLDGYEGWVHFGYVIEAPEDVVESWRQEAQGWSLGAVAQLGEHRFRLPLRARVPVDNANVRLPDGRWGRIIEGAVLPVAQAAAAARRKPPERWALEFFGGSPYQWGGVTPCGVDCSGLVQTTFAARGITLPRDSAQQAGCGAPVSLDGIRAGDLLFFRGDVSRRINHVAFAGEDDMLVHSTVTCGSALTESWLPGTRAAPLRERLVAVRRMEER